MVGCSFSHTACGRPADEWVRRYGYMSGAGGWRWGENLGLGRGRRGTARRILKAWLNSPPHRETMLTGPFDELGLGLRRVGGRRGAKTAVWVLELGCRGC